MASVRERVSKRSNETTWQVLYRIKEGAKWRQTSDTFTTEPAARRFADLIDLVGVDKAKELTFGTEPDDAGLTLDELFEQWIDWKGNVEKRVTERTLKDYRRDYDNWIRDPLGSRPAAAIDELDVQKWMDNVAGRLDAKTAIDRHIILGQIFGWGSARTRRLVPHDPTRETMLPRRVRKPPKGFTLPQWAAMHAWAIENTPDAADLMLFLVGTGWRWQEATPILAGSVEDHGDDADGNPMVWVSVDRVVRRTKDDTFEAVANTAKSRAGVRRINVSPSLGRMLRRRLIGKAPGDLVFTNPNGNRWHANNFTEREFARALKAIGIEKVKGMGPHYFRHTHVALLDRAGVSLAKMQRRIGHESISTTVGVYGGMIDNSLGATELAALDALIDDRPAPLPAGGVVRGELA